MGRNEWDEIGAHLIILPYHSYCETFCMKWIDQTYKYMLTKKKKNVWQTLIIDPTMIERVFNKQTELSIVSIDYFFKRQLLKRKWNRTSKLIPFFFIFILLLMSALREEKTMSKFLYYSSISLLRFHHDFSTYFRCCVVIFRSLLILSKYKRKTT
jgi:hypothetical protein